MSEPAWQCRNVSYRYPGEGAAALRDLDLDLPQGVMTAVLGPNGAGKSTLVRLLSGAASPSRGSVSFLGRGIDAWPRTELAQRLSVVSQEAPVSIPQSVAEYVSLGRNPYVSAWAPLSGRDRTVVSEAMERVGLRSLGDRRLSDLSGGESQRAKLARALAQEPDVLILDEPTAHLDIGHGLWAFETIADLVSEGLTAICVTHDMNLASRFADELVLLARGSLGGRGTAKDVLVPALLSDAYDCQVLVEDHGAAGHVVLPMSVAGAEAGVVSP